MKNPWVLYHKAIPDHMVDQIHAASEKYEPVEAKTGYGTDGITPAATVRKSTIKWLNYRDSTNHWIRALVLDLARDANRNNWGFRIDWAQDFQYTVYHGSKEEPGHYNWHQDIFWTVDSEYQRKVSVVVQLSDPSEYEGGVFKFAQHLPQLPEQESKDRGTVIVFPSFFDHKVDPVTAGVRKSLVSWVEGPRFI